MTKFSLLYKEVETMGKAKARNRKVPRAKRPASTKPKKPEEMSRGKAKPTPTAISRLEKICLINGKII